LAPPTPTGPTAGKMRSEQRQMSDQFTLSAAAAQLRSADDIVSGNMGDRFDITFFVSCYNEEEFIVATLDTVQEAMLGLGLTYDIVVIDDGSKDRSADLVRSYIAEHPDLNIVFRRNAVNKGWAQNYIDSTFIGKGRYHRAICGDNSEMVSTIRAVLKPLGQADIIIPYYVEVEHKSLFRHVVSSAYTFIVNLLSGNSLHYYNGLPIHRRYNVMRCHPDTRGFGFQAYILCLLLGQGATFKEVALSATERRGGTSNALTWRNLLSVAHTLTEILLRRMSNRIHGQVIGSLAAPPDHPPAQTANERVFSDPDRVG
jgi:glycosyltransferase involved in cell wall biosynthesis